MTPRTSMRVVSPSKAAGSSNTVPKTLLMESFSFATFTLKLNPPMGSSQAVSVLVELKRSTPVSTKVGAQEQLKPSPTTKQMASGWQGSLSQGWGISEVVVVVGVVVVVVGCAVVVSTPSQSGSLGQAGAATPLKLMLVEGYAPVYLKVF